MAKSYKYETVKARPLRLANEFVLSDGDCETIPGESVTVPDQAFTMREIVERFTDGIPVFDAVDSDEPDIDDDDLESVARLDLADRHELLELRKLEAETSKADIEAFAKKREKKPANEPEPEPSPKPTKTRKEAEPANPTAKDEEGGSDE